MIRKANLGCGGVILEGYENYDLFPMDERVIPLDLNKRLPFDDETFDEIILSHVLEHVVDSSFTFNEVTRVLKRCGILYVRLPIRLNVVSHLRDSHNLNYFNTYTMDLSKYKREGWSDDYAGQKYDLLYRKQRNRRKFVSWVYHLYSRLFSWIHSLYCTEYEWKMRKR